MVMAFHTIAGREKISNTNQLWEIDIKYGYIVGTGKYGLLQPQHGSLGDMSPSRFYQALQKEKIKAESFIA